MNTIGFWVVYYGLCVDKCHARDRCKDSARLNISYWLVACRSQRHTPRWSRDKKEDKSQQRFALEGSSQICGCSETPGNEFVKKLVEDKSTHELCLNFFC